MSHTFADYGNRNILTPGRTGPGMTGDVMGQGDRQAQFFSDSFQISVDTMGCVDILLSLVQDVYKRQDHSCSQLYSANLSA